MTVVLSAKIDARTWRTGSNSPRSEVTRVPSNLPPGNSYQGPLYEFPVSKRDILRLEYTLSLTLLPFLLMLLFLHLPLALWYFLSCFRCDISSPSSVVLFLPLLQLYYSFSCFRCDISSSASASASASTSDVMLLLFLRLLHVQYLEYIHPY